MRALCLPPTAAGLPLGRAAIPSDISPELRGPFSDGPRLVAGDAALPPRRDHDAEGNPWPPCTLDCPAAPPREEEWAWLRPAAAASCASCPCCRCDDEEEAAVATLASRAAEILRERSGTQSCGAAAMNEPPGARNEGAGVPGRRPKVAVN